MTPELNSLPLWRFVQMPSGEKGPRQKNWHLNPLTHDQLNPNLNTGVILGPSSGNLIALDFDGHGAVALWEAEIGHCDTITPVVSSMRDPNRFSMFFRVRDDQLATIPAMYKREHSGDHLEWRWPRTGGALQSVVPPSIHPMTKRPYEWLISPLDYPVATLPDRVLAWSQDYYNSRYNNNFTNTVNKLRTDYGDDVSEHKLTQALIALRDGLSANGHDVPCYDDWLKIVTITERYQPQLTTTLLPMLWPEHRTGEYQRMRRGVNTTRCSFGTLVNMIRRYQPNWQYQRFQILNNPN